MLLTNYHTHFELDDGSGPLSAYAESALSRGMKILGFSPHAPLPYPNDWAMQDSNLPVYLSGVSALRKEYAGRLEICTGLEIDYVAGVSGPSNEKYDSLGLDYRIGSLHSIREDESGEDLSVDGPVEDLIRLLEKQFGGDVKKLVSAYFELETEMIEKGGFDILGHCDLIKKRNTDNRFFDQNDGWYLNKAFEMLEAAAGKNLIVEVNTGGMSRGATTEVYPSFRMLERCRELNIPLTLTTDAHSPEHVDFYLKEAAEEIKQAGYKEIYFFSDGEWRSAPI